MVEIVNRDEVAVHRDVAATVDAILRNAPIRAERRQRADDGEVVITRDDDARRDPTQGARQLSNGPAALGRPREIVDLSERKAARNGRQSESGRKKTLMITGLCRPAPFALRGRGTESKPLRIYPFGVSSESARSGDCAAQRPGHHRARCARGRPRYHAEELLPAKAAANPRGRGTRHGRLRPALEHRHPDGKRAVVAPSSRGPAPRSSERTPRRGVSGPARTTT